MSVQTVIKCDGHRCSHPVWDDNPTGRKPEHDRRDLVDCGWFSSERQDFDLCPACLNVMAWEVMCSLHYWRKGAPEWPAFDFSSKEDGLWFY